MIIITSNIIDNQNLNKNGMNKLEASIQNLAGDPLGTNHKLFFATRFLFPENIMDQVAFYNSRPFIC